MKKDITYIYGLKEKMGPIRYIGKSDNPKKRLKQHYQYAKRFNNTKKATWMNKVIREGGDIILEIIEVVEYSKWQEREIYWINKLQSNNLTNHDKGGLGGAIKKYDITYDEAKKWIKENMSHIKSLNDWKENKYK